MGKITHVQKGSDPFCLITGVVLALMYVVFLNPVIDVRGFNAHDPSEYIVRTFSILNGKGYGDDFANVFLPVTAQPPIFTFLLVPLVAIFGVNFFALKIFMVMLACFFAIVLSRFFNYFLNSKKEALIATLLMMASPVIFGLSHRVLADLPLFVLMVTALLFLDCYLKSPRNSVGLLIFSAIATGLGYLTKQTALGVVAGGWMLILHPKFRNRQTLTRLTLYSLLFVVSIGMWHWRDALIPDDLWYWTLPQGRDLFWKNPFDPTFGLISVSEFFTGVRHNVVWGMSNNLAMVLFPPFYFTEGSFVGFFLSVPLIAWLVWQWRNSWIKNPSVLEGFVFFSLLLMGVKYLGMAARYMAITYPALVIYAVRGLGLLQEKARVAIFQIMILAGIGSTLFTAVDQWNNPYGSKTLKDYVAIAGKAKVEFPEESVCAAPLLSHWQILTGHKCIWGKMENFLSAPMIPNYIVGLSDQAPRDLSRFQDVERDVLNGALRLGLLAKQDSRNLEKVLHNDTFEIYKVVRHGD